MASKPKTAELGTLVAIRRYPVKSMQAEILDVAELHWTGLQGDRQYAFVRDANSSTFPWLTGREIPGLVLHQACYSNPADPKHGTLRIIDPAGAEYGIADPDLTERLAEAAGTPVRLIRLGRGAFDAMPASLITTTTGEAVSQAHGRPVDLARFRSNLVIRADDPAARERDWIGRNLAFGDGPNPPALRLDLPIPRCAMIAIDPATADRDASVLRTVVQSFNNEIGVYCAVQAPGTLRVGDRVRLVAP